MTKYLPILTLVTALSGLSLESAHAGGTGYLSGRGSHCAVSKFQTPRYFQSLPYRHFQDRRRYNAAPCSSDIVRANPYLVKTVVVRKERLPHYYYDSRGNRHCSRVLTTTYKDIYSDGSCHTWSQRG